jgi:ABC-type uncharacterized transport system permease subunit
MKSIPQIAYAWALLAVILPVQVAWADAEGEADSTNWYFAKEIKGDIGINTYWGPAKALSSTYSLEAQAWNEGGTTGLLSQGPNDKFDNVGGSPVGKEWETQKAEVPAPGTTNAKGYAWGRSRVEAGSLWGTNYVASSLAGGIVKTATIPAGGSGRARGKTTDPWAMDLPFEGANDSLELHTFIELTGSHVDHGSLGSGDLGWHLSMDGVSAYSSYLFDYSLSDEGGYSSDLLVAPGVWITLLLAIVMTVVLARTVFGRRVFAIGSNEAAARACGVATNRVKVAIYGLAGLFVGLSGVMQMSRLRQGDPTVAIGTELDIIAAVVIGGGSLAGGEGTIAGAMVGALTMAFLRNGTQQMGWPNYIQEIIIGIIIVLAVAADRVRRARAGV